LEDRLAPATLSDAGAGSPVLTLTLNAAAGETVSIAAAPGGTYTISSTAGVTSTMTGGSTFTNGILTPAASVTAINIVAGPAVGPTSLSFANSGANHYVDAIHVNLQSSFQSIPVTFLGSAAFDHGLSVLTSSGPISSAVGSSLTLGGTGNNLVLDSSSGAINLAGTVAVGGTTSLTSDTSLFGAPFAISAANTQNTFSGPISINTSLSGASIAGGSLVFATSSVASGLNAIAVTGSITQTGPIQVTSTGFFAGSTNFSAPNGPITLTDQGNSIDGSVSLTTAGANAVNLFNATDLALANVSVGTGALSLSAEGSITEPTLFGIGTAVGGIHTLGPASFTVDGGGSGVIGDILLNTAANNFGGPVSFLQANNGFVRNIGLRNVAPHPSLPTLSVAITPQDYTLQFDNAPIAMPAITINGTLSLTAGGAITETGPLTALNGQFSVLGNFGITLNSATNTFTGSVGFSNPAADGGAGSAVVFQNSSDVTLDACSLGLGTFAVTATGNIAQVPSTQIVQKRGAGAVTFSATGSMVNLGNAGNDFAGAVTITGNNVTVVFLDNADTRAALPTLPNSVTGLTLTFEQAPAVLSSFTGLTLANLTVTAQGILQQPNSTLVVTNQAAFDAGSFPLQLDQANNDFDHVTLNNSGPNDVVLTDEGAVDLSGGNLGSGQLTVTAGGAITESGTLTQQPSAVGATFSATGGSIVLNQNNQFAGPVSFPSSGATNITLRNVGSLVLGGVSANGNLNVTVTSGSLSQAPGTNLFAVGAATFSATGDVNLNSPDNDLSTVSFNANNVSFRNQFGIDLGTTNANGTLAVRVGFLGASAATTITQSGPVSASTAQFVIVPSGKSGTNAITLTDASNQLGTVSVSGVNTNVSLTTSGALSLGNVSLPSGALSVNANGGIDQLAGTSITGTTGGISLSPGTGNDITLDSPTNNFAGPVTVNGENVTLVTQGDLTLLGTLSSTGDLNLTATGQLSLPAGNQTVNSLTVTAHQANISQNLTVTGGPMSFTGGVVFSTAVTLDTTAVPSFFPQVVSFSGNVTALGALAVNLPPTSFNGLVFTQGTWNQGSNALTINGQGGLTVGSVSGSSQAIFNMTSGTMTLGGGRLTVNPGGTIAVGGGQSGQTVTVADGPTGGISFQTGSRLVVGLGATNSKLVQSGTGSVFIAGATLSGTGLAGTTATPVLDAGSGQLTGTFGTATPGGSLTPADFLMGTDIVTPTYTPTAVTIKQGGSQSVPTGFESDGDGYTVTVKGGSGLVVIKDPSGLLDIVVRNATAATTLTVTTSKQAGDGFTSIGGIAIDGPGAATIVAPTANVTGDILVGGPLAALTLRDLRQGSIQAGGTATQLTSITGRVFDQDRIVLGSVLNSLKLTAFTDTSGTGLASTVTAARFGTLSATGNALAGILGDFAANLVNTVSSALPALTKATIANNLTGTWDLAGAVGSVAAARTTNWQLGVPGGSGARDANGRANRLTNVASLGLGVVVGSTINATGNLTALTATSWNGGSIQANTFGTLKTTGNTALGDVGDFSNLSLTATASQPGTLATVLGTLLVAGNVQNTTILLQNGNAGTITVGRTLSDSSILTASPTGLGNLATVSVGAASNLTMTAMSVKALSVTGNPAASLFGDLTNSTITLGVFSTILNPPPALGTFSATGQVTSTTFTVENAGVTSFTVARELDSSTITLLGPDISSALGTIAAGEWTDDVVIAPAIGTLKATGALHTLPRSSALNGDLVGGQINAFFSSGPTPAIGTFAVTGDLDSTVVSAGNGITSLSVGRSLSNDVIQVTNPTNTASNSGRLAALTVGSWNSTDVEADTVGTVKVTGYFQPEVGTPNRVSGDVTGSNLAINSGTAGKTVVGLASMAVAGTMNTTTVDVPFGITSLTVGGTVSNSVVTADNPIAPTVGRINALTAGAWNGGALRASSIGTLATIGNAALNLAGDFTSADVTVTTPATASVPVAIATFTVGGSLSSVTMNVPASITTFTVGGTVGSTGPTAPASELAAAFGSGAGIKKLQVGSWSGADLTSQSVAAWSVVGNINTGLAANVTGGQVTILGNQAGVGLGTFTAGGMVSGATFNITDGNVTSFTVGRFFSSQLLVGFRLPSAIDLTATPATSNWDTTNRTIGLFKTTATFSASDVTDTASFRDSDVVAASLGTITIAGLDPNLPVGAATSGTIFFGLGFRSTGGSAGTASISGTPRTAPFQSGAFRYQGLAG
jgi:hypothetical protein